MCHWVSHGQGVDLHKQSWLFHCRGPSGQSCAQLDLCLLAIHPSSILSIPARAWGHKYACGSCQECHSPPPRLQKGCLQRTAWKVKSGFPHGFPTGGVRSCQGRAPGLLGPHSPRPPLRQSAFPSHPQRCVLFPTLDGAP